VRKGEALEQHGDRNHALVELDAARAAFESLGAKLDLQRATWLVGSAFHEVESGRFPE